MTGVPVGTLVQIRDLPDDVHRKLKARAAAAGMSLSAYLRDLLARTAARPTPDELAARIRIRGPVVRPESAAASVRALRAHGE